MKKRIEYRQLQAMGATNEQLNVYSNTDPLDIYEMGDDLYLVTGCIYAKTDAHGVLDLLQEMVADDVAEESAEEWLSNFWNNLRIVPEEPFDLESAEADLEMFRSEGWKLPCDLTARMYMEYMNNMISAH